MRSTTTATHSKVDASTGDVMLKVLRDELGFKPSLTVVSLFGAGALVFGWPLPLW